MTRLTQTRRRFLAIGTGTVLAGAVGGSRTLAQEGEWTAADAPIEGTINDVVRSSQGPYAVGEGGVVLTRRADGWETVLERGPTVESNALTGAGVTDDGDHVWFAGGSGVIGRYDAVDEELTDHSAPDGKTSTWEAIAVTGEAGSETVHLTNGSGEYLNGQLTEAGGVDWGEVVKPGGGSSAFGIDFVDSETGYIADTTSQVYETTDGGDSWETIGIDGASEEFRDVAAVSADEINVAAGNGVIYRYDGANWTPVTVGESTVETVTREGSEGLAAGAGGSVYEYDGSEWTEVGTPTESTLSGVALGSDAFPAVAAGGSGAIVERGEYTAEDDPEPTTGDWSAIETPVDTTLTGVAQSGRGPYAVGEGGVVLTRRADGWETVVERFPATEPASLTDVAASDDGDHVWFVGASGVVGQYDVTDYQLTDHSAPEIEEEDGSTSRKTSTWEAVAVTGAADSETIHLINGSGEYLRGTVTEAGGVDWGDVIKPGGGSSAFGIDFVDSETGYIADTTSQVYETTDGGDSWETIGVDGGSAGYNDVVARSPEEIYVAAGDGTVLRYNGAVWTKLWAGGNGLLGADATDEEAAISGAEGTIYEQTSRGFRAADVDAENTLEDVSLDASGDYPHAAVGASGTAVENGEYGAAPVEDDESTSEWEAAKAPVEVVFHGVTQAQNAYAVGEGGTVIERSDGEWSVVVEDGPGAGENTLNAVAATDLGSGVWFAGGSGALGEYDAVEGELTDHSQPEIEEEDGSTSRKTSTWEAIAVTGELGAETVHLVNGSGEYLRGTKGSDGSIDWGDVIKPGGGSSALGIDFVDSETGYVVDTTSQVYETTDGGDSWETIGVDGGSAAYTGVSARSPEEIYVSAGNGTVLRYNGAVWTAHWAGGSELNAIDADDDDVVTAGAGGTIVERTTREWATAETPTEATIYGIALNEGGVNPGLVVGNPGTIFERVGTAVDDPDDGGSEDDGDQQDGSDGEGSSDDDQQDDGGTGDDDQQSDGDQQDGDAGDQQDGDEQQDDGNTGEDDGDQQDDGEAGDDDQQDGGQQDDGGTDEEASEGDGSDGSDEGDGGDQQDDTGDDSDSSDGTDDGDGSDDSADGDPAEDGSEGASEDGEESDDDAPADGSGDGGQEDDDPDGGDGQDGADDGGDGDASEGGETGGDASDGDGSEGTDDTEGTSDGDAATDPEADADPDGDTDSGGSDEDGGSAGTASLSATGTGADGSGQYEVRNDGETAMTATITVDGETVREVEVEAGGTSSIALEGIEGSTVALCIDGEEVDRVRPADC
ncbi:hypothetical protein [Saliphagus sp. LR7]|uniref:hypothetical protein n=1 Tax=Saliphagus sp. LR7 TaxID=2282654 RepID=UPI001300A595|nr:hypothetical protein [Saliphagus sp. LR7]